MTDSELVRAVAALHAWDSAVIDRAAVRPGHPSSGTATDTVIVVEGEATNPATGATSSYSVARKTVRRNLDAPIDHWTYWKRELLSYRSGLLPVGPGLSSCRLLAASETGDEARLWLTGIPPGQPEWTLATFMATAAHLANWQADRVDDPGGPDWLVTDQLAQRIERTDAAGGLEIPDHHPDLVALALALWERRHEFVERRRRLPRLLAHGDYGRHNLAVESPAPTTTVAIDWATLGWAPPGSDLAAHVISALLTLPAADDGNAIDEIVGAYADQLVPLVAESEVWEGFVTTFALTAASRLCWTLVRDQSGEAAAVWARIIGAAAHLAGSVR